MEREFREIFGSEDEILDNLMYGSYKVQRELVSYKSLIPYFDSHEEFERRYNERD